MMYNIHLNTFVCVAACGSFNQASEKLFISPTAVMKQINSLEAQFKIRLFERTKQGVRLTAAGRSLYEDAKFLIDYSGKALEKARNLIIDPELTICVATSLLNPCKPFVDLWDQINHNFPQYKLHITPFDDDREGIASVIGALGKTNDFVVGICDSSLWRRRCGFLKLGEYKRGYAVPTSHRLAAKQSLRIADLYGETLLMSKGKSASAAEWGEIAQNHPQVKVVDTPSFYDMEVFNHCVQMGAVLASAECWKEIHPSLVTILMKPEHTVDYGLMYAVDPPEDILQIVEAIRALVE